MPDRPGVAARVFRALADAGVNIDMIVQNVSVRRGSRTSRSRCRRPTSPSPSRSSRPACKDVGAAGWSQDSDIAKVSLIGAGMRSHPGVAADMFEALAEAGINIEIISTSSIRISCVVRAADVERAVQAVHEKLPALRRGARQCLGIGVVGATGAVGTVTLELLAERGYDDVRAFASERSAGSRVAFGGQALVVEEATPEALAAGDLDLCLFSVGTSGSLRARAPRRARRRGRRRQVVGVPARRTACRSSCPR